VTAEAFSSRALPTDPRQWCGGARRSHRVGDVAIFAVVCRVCASACGALLSKAQERPSPLKRGTTGTGVPNRYARSKASWITAFARSLSRLDYVNVNNFTAVERLCPRPRVLWDWVCRRLEAIVRLGVLPAKKERAMSQTSTGDQGVERIMQRAEAVGIDPRRVAVALEYARGPTEYQAVERLQEWSKLRLRRLARRFARLA